MYILFILIIYSIIENTHLEKSKTQETFLLNQRLITEVKSLIF